jgi:hypothetical protein
MAATTIDLFTQPELLERVKADWRERMQGQVYKSPLPTDATPPFDQLEHT